MGVEIAVAIGLPRFARDFRKKMDQPQRNTSPKFYRNATILFVVIGCILLGQALAHHDWVYGTFAGITFLNALMTTFKLISLRETKQ